MNNVLESIEALRKEVKRVAANKVFDMHVTVDVALSWLDEIENEIEEQYMLLPVDMDGVPIHVGDEMQDANGLKVIVEYMSSDCFYANGASRNGWCNYRHVKPDPVKKLLEEFCKELGKRELTDSYGVVSYSKIVDEYATKIHEAVKR